MMFERRLKVVLLLLVATSVLLGVRALQLQVWGSTQWDLEAAESMKRARTIETIRGSILDRRGREVALDDAAVDACVDFRAIEDPPDPQWLTEQARARLVRRLGSEYRLAPYARRKALLDGEVEQLKADLKGMWGTLAELSGRNLREIEQIRQEIVARVQLRRRHVWYARYRSALQEHELRDPSPWYQAWLIDISQATPQLDHFDEDVEDQRLPHPILRDIDNQTYIQLKKHAERLPGLVLRDSTHRRYPYGQAACHVLGYLTRVQREDLERDPSRGDPLGQYQYNDLIGRQGLEALLETVLRGRRGQDIRVLGSQTPVERTDPQRGHDTRTTIDIELQAEIERLFGSVRIKYDDGTIDRGPAHGAAVVIDVSSGEVLALASAPAFDLNRFDQDYATLVGDELNQPLLNRATQWAVEPGSTVKPIVGMAGVAEGVLTVAEGIECTGYLVVGGRPLPSGRCWTAKFANDPSHPDIAHHQIPYEDPHPTGFLTLADALQRSCNVYFENVSGRLGLTRTREWFERFGLGRASGLGIAEARGRLPDASRLARWQVPSITYFAGIGQGQVTATPVQMANVAATIARDGVWMRPRLVAAELLAKSPTSAPADPDRVALDVPLTAIRAVQEGMRNSVARPSGTCYPVQARMRELGITVAGKSGTAQAAAYRIPQRNLDGTPVRDESGRIVYQPAIRPGTRDNPNPQAPWYRGFGPDGTNLKHGWFIGYAPAQNPQVAFAVMVEYAGSGATSAGSVVEGLIESCIKHGYVRTEK
jgi:penicillin-binding protein 2